jgi:aryl-alcohol dehydrogenase-like predicted oxidoreductase
MQYRTLGQTDIRVSAVALGCWPLAGITSPGTDKRSCVATLHACFELGINHFDTAYVYGRSGESEQLIGQAIAGRRGQAVVATKVGLHWDAQGNVAHDASPATIHRHAEESLRRLQTDYIDLLYLHCPDPKVPVAESAGALKELLDAGKACSIGVSNFNVEQLEEFSAECPIAACQPLYNMLQREIEADVLPWCCEHGVSVLAYEPLAKGLLTGKFRRDHRFDESDWRLRSPLFQGPAWCRNLDLVDRLRPIAESAGRSLVQLVINWTIRQPGLTVALCGAKRPEQIRETADGVGWQLSDEQLAEIDRILAEYAHGQG